MNAHSKSGLMIAAPSSGSGKTLLTLAILRAFKNKGYSVAAAKAGPDYIDPGFHELACGGRSVNLDPWAMNAKRLLSLASDQPGSYLLVEAMMGLFDGAADGSASPATLAKTLKLPVILVVDAARQSHSISALVRGFRDHDPEVAVKGVILNKVSSSRHEQMLRVALEAIDMPVLGAVPRNPQLELPERHLGLVQAIESPQMEAFIANAADLVEAHCDLDGLIGYFEGIPANTHSTGRLPPLAQRTAIARDVAFSFIYPHLISDWRDQGAEVSLFSPLADEAPNRNADAVYLPGGYPELHAGKLAGAQNFMRGLIQARDRGALLYGECGGYMVLGEGIVDKDGDRHAMCGLLDLETSFAKRKLHLGYRNIKATGFVLGERLKGHEFHYTSALKEKGQPLFAVADALGNDLGSSGLRNGRVMGSYMHIIDQVA